MRKNHSKIVCIKLVHLPYLASSYLSVRMENNSTPTVGIFMKFCVLVFFSKLRRENSAFITI